MGVELRVIGARDVQHDLIESLGLGADLVLLAGGVVAVNAGDIAVGGGLPAVVVGVHDVAALAESGLVRILQAAESTTEHYHDDGKSYNHPALAQQFLHHISLREAVPADPSPDCNRPAQQGNDAGCSGYASLLPA